MVLAMDVEETRRCWTCRKVLPITAFHVNYWSAGGRLRHCKKCAGERRKHLATRPQVPQDARVHRLKVKEFPYRVELLGGPFDGVSYRMRSEPPSVKWVRESTMTVHKSGRVSERVLRWHVYYRWIDPAGTIRYLKGAP